MQSDAIDDHIDYVESPAPNVEALVAAKQVIDPAANELAVWSDR